MEYFEVRKDGGKVETVWWHGTYDMAKLFKAHHLVIGAYEYLGAQVVMEFEIPDIAPVLEFCGQDMWFRDFKKK